MNTEVAILASEHTEEGAADYEQRVTEGLGKLGVRTRNLADGTLDADVVWAPALRTPHLSPHLRDVGIPVVGTVAWAQAHGFLTNRLLGVMAARPLRKHAQALITFSHFGAKMARRAVGRSAAVYPIYLGVDETLFFPNSADRGEYYLCLVNASGVSGASGLSRVLAAYGRLRRANAGEGVPPLKVLGAGHRAQGSAAFGVDYASPVHSLRGMAEWYRHAVALVLPPSPEVSGIAAIEAMACGCPVITGSSLALAEVTGNAALLANMRSVSSICRAMESLLEDGGPARERVLEEGLEHTRSFTWERCAKGHLEVFRDVLQGANWGAIDPASTAMKHFVWLFERVAAKVPSDASVLAGAHNAVWRRKFLGRLGKEVYGRFIGSFGRPLRRAATLITDREWQHLIVLDACRWDTFCYVYGEEVPFIRSPGCNTHSWVKSNFVSNPRRSQLNDTWVVSASPILALDYFNLFGWPFPARGYVDAWKRRWHEDLSTVHPADLVREVDQLLNRNPTRTITHFLQPHDPYIGELHMSSQDFEYFRPFEVERRKGLWHLFTEGEVSVRRVKRAYEDNLVLVMQHVERLIDKLEGRVVVTADHGELFGEYGLYKHPIGAYLPELMKVPWLEIET